MSFVFSTSHSREKSLEGETADVNKQATVTAGWVCDVADELGISCHSFLLSGEEGGGTGWGGGGGGGGRG